MIEERINRLREQRRCTLLGVGPVSKNTVDVAIEVANEISSPLMLIASRRQIECAEMGGGYVNNWSTEDYSEYVHKHDKGGKIILARDHGGPWQHPCETDPKMGLRQAMESAKKSYEIDIRSGFELIHIDPSIDIFKTPSVDEILERVYELYEFCITTARKHNKRILIEIGTEEQEEGTQDLFQFEYVLNQIINFCQKYNFPKPHFIVAQTGTKVAEMENIGSFESPVRIPHQLPIELQLPRILDLCDKYNIWLKEHNTDYLSNESLSWHPKLGIHSANVAPEFGVVESKAFVELLESNNLERLSQEFLELAYNSRKWEKWMLPETTATDRDRSLICGHYVFATEGFADIKNRAQSALKPQKTNVDDFLKMRVKECIYRYTTNFNLN